MTTRADRMKADLRAVLATDGEPCEYWKRGATAKTRDVLAIVQRQIPAPAGGVPGTLAAGAVLVTVLNDAADGVTAAEADCGGDRIMMALRQGGTPELRRIVARSSEDEAGIILELG